MRCGVDSPLLVGRSARDPLFNLPGTLSGMYGSLQNRGHTHLPSTVRRGQLEVTVADTGSLGSS